MYGSQFHFEQLSAGKRFSLTEVNPHSSNFGLSGNKPKRIWLLATLLLTMMLLSTVAFAGPKDSKISGGNGNANGR